MKNPRNIIAIDRVHVDSLIGFGRISTSRVMVSSSISWKEIAIQIPARLTISDKIEDGVRIHTAQLVFRTCEEVDTRERQVYRCKTADGRYYLIGTDSRPYPVTTVSEPHPDNMTDSQLNEVTVTYQSAQRIPLVQ